ncbi:hypothetical protein V5E97_28790 [Singulisphaera sp. Ch08]|uniref:Uncharacterized protein n=1 Tax=Singulisphaera sp. Ch08 TaxID=3120278 RepID=A0AAU7CAP0_9BACT
MSVLAHHTSAIERLQRMTSRLADSSLTIAEASLLRSLIHQLMDEITTGGSRVTNPERVVWSQEECSNRVGLVSSVSESAAMCRAE